MNSLQNDDSWVSINYVENLLINGSMYSESTASTSTNDTFYTACSDISTEVDGSDASVNWDPATGRLTYLRFPIRDYIYRCALPVYVYMDKKPLLELKDQRSSMRWPTIASLECFPLPRALKTIERYGNKVDVAKSNDPYFEHFEEEYTQLRKPLKTEFIRRFLLPFDDVIEFDRTAMQDEGLEDVQNDVELCQAFHTFVLGTATEAVRLLRCLEPDEDPGHKAMALRSQFYIRNNLFMDPYGMWNIFSLRDPFNRDAAPLIVVFIEPSRFGVEDFDTFVAERKIDNNQLDRPTAPADIIWAVIYEALQKGKGYKFVLTNYVRWAFGLFEPGYEKASVTEIYEATLIDLNGTIHPPSEPQGSSVIELLVRWMETPLTKQNLERFIKRKEPHPSQWC